MIKSQGFLERFSKLTLLPVIAAFTLSSAQVDASTITAPSASSATAAQAKATAKAVKKAAKAAKKKAKLCAKKPKKKKNAKKLRAKQAAAGCFASNGIGSEVYSAGAGPDTNSSGNQSSAGIDPETLPLVFTSTPGSDKSSDDNGGATQDSTGGTTDLIGSSELARVPEPGTLGLLGLTLFGFGFARRRVR